jgi:hypothetical protein
MKEKYIITTFHSTHSALKFEDLLKKNNLTIKIIPVPRQISASCGLAGRALSKDFETILDLVKETSTDIEEIYELIDGDYYKRR